MKKGSEPHYLFVNAEDVSQILAGNGIPAEHPQHAFYKQYILDQMKGTFFVSPAEMEQSILNYMPKVASLSFRETAQVKRNECDGIWAIYNGEVYTYSGDYLHRGGHSVWFKDIGLPTESIEAFFTVARGYYGNSEIVWYEDTGTREEFLKYLPELLSKIGYSTDAKIYSSPDLGESFNLIAKNLLNMKKKAQPETPQENFYEPGISDEYPKGPKKPKQRFPFYNYPDDQGNIINADPNYSNPMEYDTLPGAPPQGPGIFGDLNMRKKADKAEERGLNYILEELEKQEFVLTDPTDIEIFVNEIASHPPGFAISPNIHDVNSLILNNMEKFPRSFIKNWEIYFAEAYDLRESFSKELATQILGEVKEEEEEKEEWKPFSEFIKKRPELTEETMEASPYAELLRKYTADEIFDIASGRKEATEEEVIQAKEVITRGIVSNRLSMRKKSKKLLIKDRIKLAEEPSTPPETLAELAKDKYRDVRWRVASNPNTPPETLTELAKDENAYVRCHSGLNPSTPPEILVELSKDKDEEVRGSVALNFSTPPETLVELSKDKHWEVRQEVALNEYTPIETLIILSEDKDKGVRRQNAQNSSTPPEILAKLSKDENTSVRISVAENPNTFSETLVELSKDENKFVRRGVANNLNTPSEIQKQIKKEPDYKEEEFDTFRDVYEYYTAGEPKEKDSEENLEEVVDKEMFKLTPHGIERAPSTKPKKEPISKTPVSEELEKYTPEILNKYTEDEIFDIAAGKKTDVTAEEVEQAKDVISRGIVSSRLSMRKKGKGLKEYIRENIEEQFIIPQQLKLRFSKVAQTEFNIGDEITFDTTRYLGKGKKRVGGLLKGKGVITKKEDDTYSIKITELTEVAEDLKNIFRIGMTAEFALDEIKSEKPKVEPEKEIPVEEPKPKEKIPVFELEEEEIPTYELVEGLEKPIEKPKEEEKEKEEKPFWKELVEKAWESFKRPVTKPFGSKLNMKKIASVDEHEYKWKEIHQGKISTYIFEGFQEGLQGEKYILVNCNICKSTLMLTAKEVKAYEYKIEGLPRGWEREVKLSAKKYKGPITSILEDIAQDVWTATDLEEAKNVIINKVESSQIAEDDKRTIIDTTNKIDNLLELQKYIANSILFYEGMGTKLSMRKKAQIDKQMFFDFYGVSLLSDQYLEANPYAKQYKDTVVQEVKDVYGPLITKMCYSELDKHTNKVWDWRWWEAKFNIRKVKDLSLEQLAQIYNEGEWEEDYGGEAWGSIVESLIQLKNTTNTNQLITIIDHINDIQHNTGLMFHDFPKVEEWFSDALDVKAQSTPEGLIPYLSSDLQKLVIEDLKLKGQEVVVPERYVSIVEKRDQALDPSTSPETLAELAKDENIRWAVAGNPNTPPETLAELAKDEEFRWRVANNPNTSPETLAELAKDKFDEDVRMNVAGNPNTPPETLAELVKAGDEDVLMNVANNPNTPPEIKEQLKQTVSSKLSMRKKAVSDSRVIDKVISYFKANDLPKNYESVYAFILEHFPELSTWEIERLTEKIVNTTRKLSMRKKAEVIVEGSPPGEGSWAMYQGTVYVTYDKNKRHAVWFEELGLPSAGVEYDNVVRGYFVDNRTYIGWYGTGDYNEFYNHLGELKTSLGYPEDSEVGMIDYTTQEFQVLSMRKKAVETISLMHIFPANEWEEDFLQKGVTAEDLNDYSGNSPRSDKKVILVNKAGAWSWGDYPDVTNWVILEFVKPLNEVYVDYDELPSSIIEGRLPRGETTYEKLTDIAQYSFPFFEGDLYGAFVLDIKPDEIVNVRKKIEPEFEKQEIKKEREQLPLPVPDVMNKYTDEEILDIVSGKKTDVTKEEIEQAIRVVNEGFVKANSLSMRKKATVPVPLRMSLDYPHSWPQKKKKKKEDEEKVLKTAYLKNIILWAVYKDQVYVKEVTSTIGEHWKWFEELGLPSAGVEYDKIARGFYDPNEEDMVWYEGTGDFNELYTHLPELIEKLGAPESMLYEYKMKTATNVSVPTPSDSLHEQQGEHPEGNVYFQGKDRWISREPDQGFDIDFPSKERIKRSPWPFDDTTPTSQMMASLSMRKTAQVSEDDLRQLYYGEAEGLLDTELVDKICMEFEAILAGMQEEWGDWAEKLRRVSKGEKIREVPYNREEAESALEAANKQMLDISKMLGKLTSAKTAQEKMLAIDYAINLAHYTGKYGEYLIAWTGRSLDPFLNELGNLKISSLSMRKTAQVSLETLKQFYTDMETEQYNEKRLQYILDEWSKVIEKDKFKGFFKDDILGILGGPGESNYQLSMKIDQIIDMFHVKYPEFRYEFISGNEEEINNWFASSEESRGKEASILDYPQKHLDSAMWDLSGDLPKLKENVKGLIVERFLNYLREEGKLNSPELWCTGFYYTGSTATYRYRPTTDIDIHVKVDWEKFRKTNPDKAKDDVEEMHKDLLKVFWNTLNKEVLPDTQHPLTYYVLSERMTRVEWGEEAYDILNDSWIVPPHKMPENLDIDEKIELLEVQANTIMERLDEELGKTKRDFIDYKILKELLDSYEGDKKDIQKLLEKKLGDVESRLKGLQEEKVKIHDERYKAFDEQEPIEEGLSQNWAPGNIVFKLIEKYKYMDVLRKIKHIIEDEEITEDEEKQLEDLLEPKLSMRKKADSWEEEEEELEAPEGWWKEEGEDFWEFSLVPQHKIRNLYKQEVKGIYDEELLDDIISSFLFTLENFYNWLGGLKGEDSQAFNVKKMITTLEQAKTPQEKMIAIDTILSMMHGAGRYAEYLIEGTIEDIYSLLDELSKKANRLNMRKKAQIDKQMFFDFYGVSLLSDQYLEANPYAKQYKDTVVQEVKDVYGPLITKMCYSELDKHTNELVGGWRKLKKELGFDFKKDFLRGEKRIKDLTLEQVATIYNEGEWITNYGGKPWGHITESLIQLKNTTNTNQLITIIDHINDIQHNTGLMFHDFPKVEEWFFDALDVKAQSTPEGLIPYLSTDLQKLVIEDLQLRGQEVVAPEKYLTITEKIELAENENTSLEVFRELAKDENKEVLEAIIDNVDAPPSVLADLAKNPDSDIRYEVANNSNTWQVTLEELAEDEDPDVRREAKNMLGALEWHERMSASNLNMRKKAISDMEVPENWMVQDKTDKKLRRTNPPRHDKNDSIVEHNIDPRIDMASLNMRRAAKTLPTREELLRLYKQEAKGIYDEELEDEIISGFIVGIELLQREHEEAIEKLREEGHTTFKGVSIDEWAQEEYGRLSDMFDTLYGAGTPQEKMLAIDRVLNTFHEMGKYVEYLVVDGDEAFLDELGNLKISSLNMRKKAGKKWWQIVDPILGPQGWEYDLVPQNDLRQLYKQEVKGIYDEELMDDIISRFVFTLTNFGEWLRRNTTTSFQETAVENLIQILGNIATPQEKMIAIDRVLNIVHHNEHPYGEYLIEGTNPSISALLDELSNLKVSSLSMRKAFYGQPTDKNYNSPSSLLREDPGPDHPSEPAQAEIPGTADDDQWGNSNKLKKNRPTKEKIFPDFQTTYKSPGGEVGQY